MAKKTKRKRLVLGRDFDGWVVEYYMGGYRLLDTRAVKPLSRPYNGEWVRVKFTKVEP